MSGDCFLIKTIAPIASLDVFAAPQTITADNQSTSTSGDTYVLSGAGITAFTVTAEGVTVVDVNGVSGATIKVDNAKAKVTIKNSKKLKNNGTDIPTVNVTVTTAKSVTLSGNFREGTITDTDGVIGYGDPRAKVGDDTYVCQGAISKGFLLDEDVNVEALHGSVSISNLGAGRWAYVSDTADKGTTITASTDDDTTLQKYVTTYTFGYYAPKDLNPGNMGSYRGSVGTYTDTRYYGGLEAPAATDGNVALTSDANLDGVTTDEDALLAGTKIFSSTGIAYQTVKSATKASSVTIGMPIL